MSKLISKIILKPTKNSLLNILTYKTLRQKTLRKFCDCKLKQQKLRKKKSTYQISYKISPKILNKIFMYFY